MTTDPSFDQYDFTRKLYNENLWLRHLLTTVAEDLESLAARRPPEAQVLLRRAQRVRRRLWEGYRGQERGPHS